MDKGRRGEIALMLAEEQVIDRGLPGAEQLKRDVGNQAKKLGIKTEELMEFYRSCMPRALGRMFGFDEVSLQMKGPGIETSDQLPGAFR